MFETSPDPELLALAERGWVPVPSDDLRIPDGYGELDEPATLRAALQAPPGPATVRWASYFVRRGVVPADRPLLGQLVARCESWVASLRLAAIDALDAGVEEVPPPPQPAALPLDGPEPAVLDTALAFGLTPGSAYRELERSRQLRLMPLLRAALAAGGLTYSAVKALLAETAWLDERVLGEADRLICSSRALSTLTWGKATRLGRRIAMVVDPAGAAARHRERRRAADVRLLPLDGGGSLLMTELGGLDGAVMMAEIERAASVLEADAGMSAGAARVEAHRRLVLAGAAGLSACPCCAQVADGAERASRRRRGRVQVLVQVGLDTVLGASEAPAELVGHGPITAEEARERVFDPDLATWRRLVFDPLSGGLLDRGRAAYRPPPALQQFVVARDGGCAMPTCERTEATHVIEADHEQTWEDGGATDAANLLAADTGCHVGRHQGGWSVSHDALEGTVTWTDRFGNSYSGALTDHRPPALAVDSARRAWLLSLIAQAPRDRRPRRRQRAREPATTATE